MCKLKSCIVLKDRIYMPDHDNHSRMLKELKIKDDSLTPNFVRAELSPADGDMFTPVETWKLLVDQDFRPDWFFEEVEGPKIIEATKAWAKEHIFIDRHDLELTGNQSAYIKNCTVISMRGSSTVQDMRGSSTVRNMWDSSTVQDMWGSSTVQDMRDSSIVQDMWGSSIVRDMRGNSIVQDMRGNSIVRDMRGNSIVQDMRGNSIASILNSHDKSPGESICFAQNATFRDMRTNQVFCSKDMQIVRFGGEGA